MATRNMKKGLVPYPKIRNRYATNKVNNVGMNRIGPRTERGTCWHRGLSGQASIDAAVDWLLLPTTAGLTDFYIDHRTGEMIRMIPPLGTASDMTPWAQGPWNQSAASSDARAFVAKYMPLSNGKGVSVWNSDLISIEITGDANTPISDATKKTMIQWTAAQAHDLGVTGDRFPINNDGISIMYGHREGCGEAYKACPFIVVWTYINSDEFIDAVRDLLDHYQLGTAANPDPEVVTPPVTEPTYAPLSVPQFLKDLIAGKENVVYVDSGGTRFYEVTDQYRALRTTPRLQYATPDSKKVGPDMQKGEEANIAFIFTSDTDKKLYGLSYYGTRFRLEDFEKISDLPAK